MPFKTCHCQTQQISPREAAMWILIGLIHTKISSHDPSSSLRHDRSFLKVSWRQFNHFPEITFVLIRLGVCARVRIIGYGCYVVIFNERRKHSVVIDLCRSPSLSTDPRPRFRRTNDAEVAASWSTTSHRRHRHPCLSVLWQWSTDPPPTTRADVPWSRETSCQCQAHRLRRRRVACRPSSPAN